jgi:hypothetical protein
VLIPVLLVAFVGLVALTHGAVLWLLAGLWLLAHGPCGGRRRAARSVGHYAPGSPPSPGHPPN